MNVAACPRCEAQVTAPPGAPISARVKCPLCDAEFPLGEIYARLPPMLLIVDLPAVSPAGFAASGVPMSALMGAEASMTPRTTGAMQGAGAFESLFDSPSEGGEMGLSSEHPSAASGMGAVAMEGDGGEEFSFADADDAGDGMLATSAVGATPAGGASTAPAQRPKKKGRNPIKELMKVAIGGVVGIMLGWYIALWAMGQDFGDLTPKFPTWMAWALPAKFKPAVKEAPHPDNNASENTASNDGGADNSGAAGDETQRVADGSSAGTENGDGENPPADTGAKQDAAPGDDASDGKTPANELPGSQDKAAKVPAKEEGDPGKSTDGDKPAEPATNGDQGKPAADAPAADVGPGKTAPNDAGKPKKPVVEDPVIIPPSDEGTPAADSPKTDKPAADKPPADKPAADQPATDKPEGDKPAIEKPIADPPVDDPTAPPGDDPGAKTKPVEIPASDPAAEGKPGLKVDAPLAATDVAKSLSAAQATAAVLNPEDAAAKKAFTKEKYEAFGKLCESMNSLAHGAVDVDNVKAANSLAATVVSDDDSAHVVAQLANAWLSRKRANDGVVIVGAIKSLETKDGLTRATIELPAVSKLAARTETIVMPANDTAVVGDEVVVAGTVVEKPQEAIRGFTGADERVVWGAAMQRRK
jgi:hypothetical protein